MVEKIIGMEEIKKEAVRAYDGMIVCRPQFLGQAYLKVSELTPEYNGCYAEKNSIVCFVTDNDVYVIPFTTEVESSLRTAGFKKADFQVPFSCYGDYPVVEMEQWESLLKAAKKAS